MWLPSGDQAGVVSSQKGVSWRWVVRRVECPPVTGTTQTSDMSRFRMKATADPSGETARSCGRSTAAIASSDQADVGASGRSSEICPLCSSLPMYPLTARR